AFRVQLTPRGVVNMYRATLGRIFMPLLWMGVCLSGAALAGQLGSTKLGVSFQKLAPDPKRLNPLQKIKNLPSQNMASLVQAMLFLPLIGLAVYGIARDNLMTFAGLSREAVPTGLGVVAGALKALLWKAAILFAVIGGLDFL